MKSLQTLACAMMAGASILAVASAAGATPMLEKGAVAVAASGAEPVRFEVFLPLRNTADLDALLARQQDKASADFHRWLTPDQFKARFGPTAASVARAEAALRAQGFTVSAEHTRSFEVTGTSSAVAKAFSTRMLKVQPVKGAARLVADTPLVLPAALQAEGAAILAFNGRPPAQKFSVLKPIVQPINVRGKAGPDNRYGAEGPYWFDDLKQAYHYPTYQLTFNGRQFDGTGTKVAVLMSNDVLDSDVTAYFENESFAAISGKGADPHIVHDYVNGGGTFDAQESTEATLDVTQVLGGAPGATVGLVSIPDLSDGNISAGLIHIIGGNYYDVVNMSYGSCELLYDDPAYAGPLGIGTSTLEIYHSLFQQGNAQGITFVAASGDSGGLLCPSSNYYSGSKTAKPKWVVGVSSPAADPAVTAVGGGNLVTTATSGSLNSAYVSENGNGDPESPYDPQGVGLKVSGGYWGAGGGLSTFWPAPSYQTALGINTGSTTARTVPDVGMHVGGCPGLASKCNATDSADALIIGGNTSGVIGTSAASPEFVGVLALMVQLNGGRLGNVNPFLYQANAAQAAKTGATVFRHPTTGFDGKYHATQPSTTYNYIYGNGTPIVQSLLSLIVPSLAKQAAAGVPQTASNP